MNFKLNEQNGKVKYVVKQKGGNVGGETSLDSANWLLKQHKPEKSDEFPGYSIAVKVQNNEYFFDGEWLMGGAKNVLSEDAPQSASKAVCGPDYCEVDAGEGYSRKGADKPQKRRRVKDVVCE